MRSPQILAALSVFLGIFLFAPSAYAQSGFPTDGIWLSTTKITSGDEVKIYTLVYNSSDKALNDTLVFSVDGNEIASMSVDVAAGASKIYSAPWKAGSGAHTFAASLSSGSVATTRKTGEVKIAVAEPPPPTALQQTLATAQSVASTSIPVVSNVFNTIYQTTENLRESGIAFAEQYAKNDTSAPTASNTTESANVASAAVASNSNVDGFVKGTSTSNVPRTSIEGGGIMARLAELAAPGILLTFSSKAIFYPALCLLLLFLIWLALRFVNRERY